MADKAILRVICYSVTKQTSVNFPHFLASPGIAQGITESQAYLASSVLQHISLSILQCEIQVMPG